MGNHVPRGYSCAKKPRRGNTEEREGIEENKAREETEARERLSWTRNREFKVDSPLFRLIYHIYRFSFVPKEFGLRALIMTEGYIQHHYKVLEDQYKYTLRYTDGFNDHTRRFVNHVVVSYIYRLNRRADTLLTPISSELIRKVLRNTCLADAVKLLTVKPHSYFGGRCKEYAPQDWYFEGFANIGADLSGREYLQAEKVNYFTGKRAKAAVKSLLYDGQRNERPVQIVQAIKAIANNGCPFNMGEIEQHLGVLKEARDSSLKDHGRSSRQYEKENGRYINDLYCFRAVLDQNPVQTSVPGVYTYRPAYFVADTGRIQQVRGGLQSCSRRMKHAAYSGIEDLRNYDLKGSHLSSLILEFSDACIDQDWLTVYLNTKDAKHIYAERAGVSVGCWKQCVLALVMGARLPKSTSNREIKYSSIMKELLDEAENDLDKADGLRVRLSDVVAPFIKQLDKWHIHLLTEYINQSQESSRKGAYITNRTGMKLDLRNLILKGSGKHKAVSKISAFLLQGWEAAFIHALTVLDAKYGYVAVANEHDGLVVIGDIPERAIREASMVSGFRNAELMVKPFI